MPGVKGSGGPPPKRSDQRRRRNKPAAGDPTSAEGVPATPIAPDPDWHPVARQWFESLARSGQAAFYQQSDWASAFVIAESISRELHPQPIVDKDGNVTMVAMPPKAASVAAWLKGMTSLLATEGDRRRAALELTLKKEGAEKEGSADVSELDEWRQRLHGDSAG